MTRIAAKLPFAAEAVTQKLLDKRADDKRRSDELNLNPWTKKYVIQNNLNGCHNWMKPIDHKWFGEYL